MSDVLRLIFSTFTASVRNRQRRLQCLSLKLTQKFCEILASPTPLQLVFNNHQRTTSFTTPTSVFTKQEFFGDVISSVECELISLWTKAHAQEQGPSNCSCLSAFALERLQFSESQISSVQPVSFNNRFNSVLSSGDFNSKFIKLIHAVHEATPDNDVTGVSPYLYDVIDFVGRSLHSCLLRKGIIRRNRACLHQRTLIQCNDNCDVVHGDLIECDVTVTSSNGDAVVSVRNQTNAIVARFIFCKVFL